MSFVTKFGLRLVRDENGQEIVEYALLLGMIVCACIAMMSALGAKVMGRWAQINELL